MSHICSACTKILSAPPSETLPGCRETGLSSWTLQTSVALRTSDHGFNRSFFEPYGNFPDFTGSKRPICTAFQTMNTARRYKAKHSTCSVVRIPVVASFIKLIDLQEPNIGTKGLRRIASAIGHELEKSYKPHKVISTYR